MKLQEKIVEIAKSQVGVREQGGNNKGEDIRKYLDATWFDENAKQKGFPWCSAYVTWVCMEARKELSLTWRDLNLYVGGAANAWKAWANEEGWPIYSKNEEAKPGDLILFDFRQDGAADHIGVVIEDKDNFIVTVEGNTNGKGERDSESGDGVWRKKRKRKLVDCFIRFPQLPMK
jgi:hypothetical protein